VSDVSDVSDLRGVEAIVSETVEFVTVGRDADGRLVGKAPDWFGERLFGGFVVAQAVHAAAQESPDGKRIHSLHGYFLRPAFAGKPMHHDLTTVKDGRSFAVRRLDVSQDEAPVFTMTCSYTADSDDPAAYEYQLPPDEADDDRPRPGDAGFTPQYGPGPWAEVWLGPTAARADGTMASTHRAWMKTATALPTDDPALHAAFLGFFSDMTGVGGRPLLLDHEAGIEGMISLDHAVWFHRPARADEWLFYDVHSLVNAGGRGVLRGTMRDEDGRLLVSVAQEMLLIPPASAR
jgi:acyl-CoA thioesterase-2